MRNFLHNWEEFLQATAQILSCSLLPNRPKLTYDHECMRSVSLHLAVAFALICTLVLRLDCEGQNNVARQPTFVRQFSSAQDVKRDHPILDKALDIAAGRKEQAASTDVLKSPVAVATDSSKRIYVVDAGSPSIHVFDFGRGKYLLLSSSARMNSPQSITADRDGNVYVTDGDSRSVLVFDARGKFSHELMRSHRRESYFEEPRGIAIHNGSGRIYVCDTRRHMVIILSRQGKVLGRIGTRGGGKGAGEFANPTQVAVSGDSVYVLDPANLRVDILDIQGRFQRQITVADASERSGLAVDASGNLYLSDSNLGQIHVLDPQGHWIYKFGNTGEKEGQFNRPSGLWIQSGCLFVADTNNRRVQEFRIDGNRCE